MTELPVTTSMGDPTEVIEAYNAGYRRARADTASASVSANHYGSLADAERLAPHPRSRETATRDDWARHFAATALAAHAEFRRALPTIRSNPELGSRPDLGMLSAIATSATAAACVLTTKTSGIAGRIWDLTPEVGALNGEYVDWLADTLARLGVNPAHLYPWFDATDFEVTK